MLFLISTFVLETSRIKRSAGVISRASAILMSISREGFALPASIPPIVPVPQSHRTASRIWDMLFSVIFYILPYRFRITAHILSITENYCRIIVDIENIFVYTRYYRELLIISIGL